ncbi:MAG: hypothetical protein LBS64_04845 [Spirochaetaceae bacterium]|jgi:hypothetical protein|nr:hypothetical protein [Spirochaetaceae bacterium]
MTGRMKGAALATLLLWCGTLGVSAADSVAKEQNWVLAAAPFSVTAVSGRNMGTSATLIPSYILDQLSGGLVHRILPDEKQIRLLRELQTQQQAIFLELSAAIKKRDSAIFESSRPRQIKKLIKAEEKKIRDIKARIDGKTLEIRAVFPEYGQDLQVRETWRTRRNAAKVSKIDYGSETVVLWKDDAEILFTQIQNTEGDFLAPVELERALAAEKINALVMGSIRIQDEYAAVQAEVRRYPGGVPVAATIEIGRLDDVETLARRIAYAFLPHIENYEPARITFAFPAGIPETFRINVDDMVFSTIPNARPLSAGFHQVSVEAPGFQPERITADFSSGTAYQIDVVLTENQLRAVSLALKQQTQGLFMIQGISQNIPAESVNLAEGKTLGRFDPDGANQFPGYFVIPPRAASSPHKNWVVDPNTSDISARIEKSRKQMYLAYSLFMTFLPITVIAQGEYVKSLNGSLTGANDMSKANLWKNGMYIAAGTTVALGITWIWQLIRYLRVANEVVPVEAKPLPIAAAIPTEGGTQ